MVNIQFLILIYVLVVFRIVITVFYKRSDSTEVDCT
jgi:hypothetical protein